jgi:hypothetical protein
MTKCEGSKPNGLPCEQKAVVLVALTKDTALCWEHYKKMENLRQRHNRPRPETVFVG